MKKIFFAFVALSISQLTVNIGEANGQSWQFAKQLGGNIGGSNPEDSREEVVGMEVDRRGNSYILFRTYTDLLNPNKIQLDGTDLGKKFGNNDMVLASFDCTGKLRWGKVFGGKGSDNPAGLKIDTLGGIYIIGYVGLNNVSDTVKIDDDTTILSPTVSSIKDYRQLIIMKYDSLGNYKWLRLPEPDTIGSNRSSILSDFAVNPTGQISLLTSIRTTGAFASGAYVVPISTILPALHMLHFDANGNFIKGTAMSVSGSSVKTMRSIRMAWDWKNDVYYLSSIKTLGEPALTFGSTTQTGAYALAKYSNTGSLLWIQQTSNTGNFNSPIVPILDKSGNVYVATGDFDGATFCGHTAKDSFYSSGSSLCLVKLNSAGTLQWGTNISKTIGSGSIGSAISNNNEVALYAGISGNIKIGPFSRTGSGSATVPCQVVFDAATGKVKSFDTIRGNNLANFNAACADAHGNFYSAYSYDVNLKVGATTLGKYGGLTDIGFVKFGEASCDPLPTSIVEGSVTSKVKIYPNPANDFLYIDGLQSSTELSLYNIVGQEVRHLSTQKSKEQISISELPSGMYLLQLKTTTGEVYTTKIVKE